MKTKNDPTHIGVTCINASDIKLRLNPVGNFLFTQEGEQAATSFLDDMTPLESANIAVLLSTAAASVGVASAYAWVDYIRDNGLERHFTIKSF